MAPHLQPLSLVRFLLILPLMHPVEPTEIEPRSAASAPASATPGWLDTRRFALALAVLVFLAFPSVMFGLRTFVFRDFGLFSYPVAFFARESFWHGGLPLWNPLNHCGVPFLAQWNTMVLYPPSLLYLVLPLSWSLSFFCLLHLFWAGLGMFFLARRWTGAALAGGLAGLIFAFNGLSLNFLMWPSHIATFSWVPWVLWLGQRAWWNGRWDFVWACGAAAMQMLAGAPETILVTWVLLALIAFGDWLQGQSHAVQQTKLRFTRLVLILVAMASLVALLCAAQLLPFLALLQHSQRDSSYAGSAHDWAMPIWGWANFLVPLFRTNPTSQGVFMQNLQYWTSSYYAGIGTVWLGFIALWRVREWRVRLLAGLCFLALVLAWGNTSVLFSVLRWCFPGLGLVRYPVKFVIVVLAVAPVLAAYGMAALIRGPGKLGGCEWVCALVLLALVGLIVAVDRNAGAGIWQVTWHNGLSRAGFLVIEVLVAGLVARRVWPAVPHTPSGLSQTLALFLGVLLLCVFYLDLLTHVPNQNPTVAPSVYSPGWVRTQLHWNPEPKSGTYRAMISPSARDYLSQNPLVDPAENQLRNRLAGRANANLFDDIPAVDGFFSLVPREAWQVTGWPYARPDHTSPALLDFMAVAQATKPGTWTEWCARSNALPLITAGQQPIFADDRDAFNALTQTNVDLSKSVFLPPEARDRISATGQSAARVTAVEFGGHKIKFRTEAPATSLVVLSQSYYPAWKAYIDGQSAELWRANYAFQAIEVSSGNHVVELRYEDHAFRLGAVLSGLGLLVWLGLCIRPRATGQA